MKNVSIGRDLVFQYFSHNRLEKVSLKVLVTLKVLKSGFVTTDRYIYLQTEISKIVQSTANL